MASENNTQLKQNALEKYLKIFLTPKLYNIFRGKSIKIVKFSE